MLVFDEVAGKNNWLLLWPTVYILNIATWLLAPQTCSTVKYNQSLVKFNVHFQKRSSGYKLVPWRGDFSDEEGVPEVKK